MKYLYLLILVPSYIFATGIPTTGVHPYGSIWSGNAGNGWTLEETLAYVEKFLLQGVLPLLVVGVMLYVGYQLLTAEGDEEKMKKAFKAISYASIGLIAIACSYAFVAIISGLSL